MDSNYEDSLFDLSGDEAAQVEAQDLGTPYDPESDDSIFGDQDPTEEDSQKSAEDGESKKFDYVERILRERGIDKNNIRFQNDNGDIELYDFDELSDVEKYDLLNQPHDLPITDEEINTLNFLRSNQINLQEFAQYQREQAIKDYLAQNSAVSYTVDQLSDDDLYRFDLLDKFPDLTDEEVEDELDMAKLNDAMYTRKVQALRQEYKQLEDDKLEAEEAEAQQQRDQQFDSYARNMVNVASATDELHGLEIEDQDKERILSFLLDKDVNGQSGFFKLFNDPRMCFRMAWYALYGDQAFDSVNKYYKSVIEQSRRHSSQPQPKRSVRKSSPKTNTKPSDDYGMDKYFK